MQKIVYFLILLALAPVVAADDAERQILQDQGRAIYELGVLPSGQPLKATRTDGVSLEGEKAACTQCHRPSGFGGIEANAVIPPVAGRYLFPRHAEGELDMLLNPVTYKVIFPVKQPYDLDSMHEVLVNGVKSDGSIAGQLMPRYALEDEEVEALTAYLQQLSLHNSPGIHDRMVSFATIITPDVSPAQKQMLVDLLGSFVRYRNANWAPGGRKMRVGTEAIPRKERQWELTLWELEGPESTWQAQLEKFYREKPVFAIVSGISNSNWQPVDDFCQAQKIPCLFPSIPVTPNTENKRYGFYFTEGVAFEAKLLASHLLNAEQPYQKVYQLYKNDKVGQTAAQALTRYLQQKIPVENLALDGPISAEQLQTIANAEHAAVVLWTDVNSTQWPAKFKLKTDSALYFSASMAGMEMAQYPKQLQKQAYVIYPFEIPNKRFEQINKLKTWLSSHTLKLVDQKLQSEIFFNMFVMNETFGEMMDNLVREYMLERTEWIMGQPINVTVYPPLVLGPNQRIVSKSGYIMKFGKTDLEPVADRMVPDL